MGNHRGSKEPDMFRNLPALPKLRSTLRTKVLQGSDDLKSALRDVEHTIGTKNTYLALPHAINKRFEDSVERLADIIHARYADEKYLGGCEEYEYLVNSEIAYYAGGLGISSMTRPDTIRNVITAASIYIMDYCYEHREKIDTLVGILKDAMEYYASMEDDINPPKIETSSWDKTHIQTLYRIIRYRNREALSKRKDERDRKNNELLNSITATGYPKNETYQDRQLFDRLMALIADNAKEIEDGLQAVLEDRLDDMFMPLKDINRKYAGKLHELNASVTEQMAAIRSFMEEMPKKVGVIMTTSPNGKYQLVHNPLLMNPLNTLRDYKNPIAFMNAMESSNKEGEISQNVGQVTSLINRTNKLYEEFKQMYFEQHDVMLSRIMIADLQCYPDKYRDLSGKELPSDDVLLQNPYAMSFALIWALENGHDFPWLGGFTDQLCFLIDNEVPWAKGLSSLYLGEEEEEEQATESDENAWYQEMHTPSVSKKVDGTEIRFSTAQVMYEDTAHLLPSSIGDLQRYYSKYEAMGYTKQEAFLMSCIVQIYRNTDETRDTLIEHNKNLNAQEDGEESEEVRELKERLREMKNLCDAQEKRTYAAEKALRKKEEELEALGEEHALEKAELADLREMMFNIRQGTAEEEPEEKKDVQLPYEVKKQTLVFGGHKTWLKAIQPMLEGNIRFIEDKNTLNFDTRVISAADVIWIQNNAISHSAYYRIVDQARIWKKQVRYFSQASALGGAYQVVEEDRK